MSNSSGEDQEDARRRGWTFVTSRGHTESSDEELHVASTKEDWSQPQDEDPSVELDDSLHMNLPSLRLYNDSNSSSASGSTLVSSLPSPVAGVANYVAVPVVNQQLFLAADVLKNLEDNDCVSTDSFEVLPLPSDEGAISRDECDGDVSREISEVGHEIPPRPGFLSDSDSDFLKLPSASDIGSGVEEVHDKPSTSPPIPPSDPPQVPVPPSLLSSSASPQYPPIPSGAEDDHELDPVPVMSRRWPTEDGGFLLVQRFRKLEPDAVSTISSSISDFSSVSAAGRNPLNRHMSESFNEEDEGNVSDNESDSVSETSSNATLPVNMTFRNLVPGVRQYLHHRDDGFNSKLSLFTILVLTAGITLGIGHFIGSSQMVEHQRTVEEGQVLRLRTLQDELVTCMSKKKDLSRKLMERKYVPPGGPGCVGQKDQQDSNHEKGPDAAPGKAEINTHSSDQVQLEKLGVETEDQIKLRKNTDVDNLYRALMYDDALKNNMAGKSGEVKIESDVHSLFVHVEEDVCFSDSKNPSNCNKLVEDAVNVRSDKTLESAVQDMTDMHWKELKDPAETAEGVQSKAAEIRSGPVVEIMASEWVKMGIEDYPPSAESAIGGGIESVQTVVDKETVIEEAVVDVIEIKDLVVHRVDLGQDIVKEDTRIEDRVVPTRDVTSEYTLFKLESKDSLPDNEKSFKEHMDGTSEDPLSELKPVEDTPNDNEFLVETSDGNLENVVWSLDSVDQVSDDSQVPGRVADDSSKDLQIDLESVDAPPEDAETFIEITDDIADNVLLGSVDQLSNDEDISRCALYDTSKDQQSDLGPTVEFLEENNSFDETLDDSQEVVTFYSDLDPVKDDLEGGDEVFDGVTEEDGNQVWSVQWVCAKVIGMDCQEWVTAWESDGEDESLYLQEDETAIPEQTYGGSSDQGEIHQESPSEGPTETVGPKESDHTDSEGPTDSPENTESEGSKSGESFNDQYEKVRNIFKSAWSQVGDISSNILHKSSLQKTGEEVMKSVHRVGEQVGVVLDSLKAGAEEEGKRITKNVEDIAKAAWNKLENSSFETLKGNSSLQNATEQLRQSIKTLGKQVIDTWSSVETAARDAHSSHFKPAMDTVKDVVKDAISKFKGRKSQNCKGKACNSQKKQKETQDQRESHQEDTKGPKWTVSKKGKWVVKGQKQENPSKIYWKRTKHGEWVVKDNYNPEKNVKREKPLWKKNKKGAWVQTKRRGSEHKQGKEEVQMKINGVNDLGNLVEADAVTPPSSMNSKRFDQWRGDQQGDFHMEKKQRGKSSRPLRKRGLKVEQILDQFDMSCKGESNCVLHQKEDAGKLLKELIDYRQWLWEQKFRKDVDEVEDFMEELEEFIEADDINDEDLEDLKDDFEEMVEDIERTAKKFFRRKGSDRSLGEGDLQEGRKVTQSGESERKGNKEIVDLTITVDPSMLPASQDNSSAIDIPDYEELDSGEEVTSEDLKVTFDPVKTAQSKEEPYRRKHAGFGYQSSDDWYFKRAKDREMKRGQDGGWHIPHDSTQTNGNWYFKRAEERKLDRVKGTKDSDWYFSWMEERKNGRVGVTVWDMFKWFSDRYAMREDLRHFEMEDQINWFLRKP